MGPKHLCGANLRSVSVKTRKRIIHAAHLQTVASIDSEIRAAFN